jgi:glycosyltransferase involved in cell wall biosynthesis
MLVAPAKLNALDTTGIDVLHLHGDDWFYVRRRVPTVRTFHGSALFEARTATRARRRASQYVTYGLELSASRLATRSYGVIPGDGPGYATCGHLPLAFEAVYAAREIDRASAPTVLFVGTWNGRKRGRFLQEAFIRHVRPRVPDARLVMVSDHCDHAPGVHWAVRPSDDELAELYREAWVFCLPSSYEGFGQPYLEAMAHGTPVIATSNPGSRFVLDRGRYGILAGDDELGDRLATLLTDEPARIELANAGRRRAAEFGWDQLLDRHERAYLGAIEAFRSSPLPPRPSCA